MQEHGEADEARIAALFREAASGAPPPGFDATQVVATSRRITRRRRSAVAGAALAVLAVVGVGVVAGLGGPSDATVTAASGQAADAAGSGSGAGPEGAARAAAPEAAAPDAAGGAAAGSPFDPSAASSPGGAEPVPAPGSAAAAVPPIGTPLGPGTGECADRQDPALRALVDQALPEVVGAPKAATTLECRPGGERGVVLEVGGGILTVTYLPPGAVTAPQDGALTAPTASGGTVVVGSRADRAGDAAPLADRLEPAMAYLAPHL
jgi:hypothetical protein